MQSLVKCHATGVIITPFQFLFMLRPSVYKPEQHILKQCCQICGFPANLGFFCGVSVFFKDLRVASFWTCFNWNLLAFCACFFADFCFAGCFFQILWHFCRFNLLLKAYWAWFCANLLILGLFSRICRPHFLYNFLGNFSFFWNFLPTNVGLVFRLNYLFLACFSIALACFRKITWHHCPQASSPDLSHGENRNFPRQEESHRWWIHVHFSRFFSW